MTFVDIPTRKPVRGRERPTADERVSGRIDRCGYDAGGEYGANWIFSVEGMSRTFSASPSRVSSGGGSGSSGYVERTFALSRPGDEVTFTISPTGRITAFDNLTSGRTMETMLAEHPRTGGGGRLLEFGMTLAIMAVVLVGVITMMNDFETRWLVVAETNLLVERSQAIENAAGYFSIRNERPPATVEELATWAREAGMDTGGRYGATSDWTRWRFAETGAGRAVVVALEDPEDLCRVAGASEALSGRWYCSDDSGRAAEADEATSFAHVLKR